MFERAAGDWLLPQVPKTPRFSSQFHDPSPLMAVNGAATYGMVSIVRAGRRAT